MARWRISRNTGDSSTERRINQPTKISTMENRNGTRQPQAAKLSADIRAIVASDIFLDRVKNLGINAYGNAPSELRAWMTKEMARWKEVAQASNIKGD